MPFNIGEEMPQPERNKPAVDLIGYLDETISHLEKANVSLTDSLSYHLSSPYPPPTEPSDVRFPGGDSQLASKLREFCLRVESVANNLNELKMRTEL